jgi:hypothetical protein
MQTYSSFYRKIAACLIFVFVSLFHLNEANAQPALQLKRIINNWPTIEIYVEIACQGLRVYNLDKSYFEVYENYHKINDFTMWCPDHNARCMISACLVFDCSASMKSVSINAARDAARKFVSYYDGKIDETCIMVVDSSVRMVQAMTYDKTLLNSAISKLSARDSTASDVTAVWDGCYEGLEELIKSGTNSCRAVILISDGKDNASAHNPSQIITLATHYRIRVFTIGLGDMGGSAELRTIATSTGGSFYSSPTPYQVRQMFEDITANLYPDPGEECLITYQAGCLDGSKRVVDVILKDFCNGADQKSGRYVAPRDTSTFTDLNIRLGKASAAAGEEVTIPLILDTPVNGEYLSEADFSIQLMNPSCGIKFLKIETPPGSLLEGVPIIVTPDGSTVSFSTTQSKMLNGSGVLAELTFTAGDPLDTCCSEIKVSSWPYTGGCFRTMLSAGEICIVPRRPAVLCNMTCPSSLTWDAAALDYTPNPVTVTMQVLNTGDNDARNARFRIEYDPSEFILAGPLADMQSGYPVNVLRNDGVSEAKWDLRALPQSAAKDAQVCIVASFDNHPDIGCCTSVSIPANHVVSAASAPQPVFGLDVFPEPNDGRCTVCMKLDAPGDVELTVCDLLGRTVYTHRAYVSSRELTHSIDLAGVPAGSYVLHAVSGKHSIMKMLVKEAR